MGLTTFLIGAVVVVIFLGIAATAYIMKDKDK